TSNDRDFRALTHLFQSGNSNNTIQKNQYVYLQNKSYISQLSLLTIKPKSKNTTNIIKNNLEIDNSLKNVNNQFIQAEAEVNSNQKITPISSLIEKPITTLYSNQTSSFNFKKTKEPEECLRLNKIKIKAFADLYYSSDLPIRNIESKSDNFNSYVS